ncbi:MAG TPA: ATP-binding protein [Candidatus Eisenbacteria bacterium]|nr:ATP-binding protein [Candidatus Eisenbacteria bacterium]
MSSAAERLSRATDRGRRPTARRAAPRAAAAQDLSPDVLDRLSDGIVVVGPDGRARSWNRAARDILAIGPRTRPGADARDLLRSVVPGEDLVTPALAGKRIETETLLQNARGEEIPVRAAFLPLGAGRGTVAVLADLTKMRRLEQELRQRERLSLVGQLSAGVAHEVRNPLAGISSSAQVLLERFEPRDERTRFVKAILDEVGRLDRIVSQLLQFARPGEPRLRKGSLADTVRHLLETSGPWLVESGVEVETVLARVPDSWFDPDLVHQVLLNLVANAVQAMPKGGKLRLELRSLARRGLARGSGRRREDRSVALAGRIPSVRVVQVRIADTGEGIAKEHLSRLFDPFFTTKPSGTGLGLSICQSIVQEHGGSIHVASRLQHGTTVLVELPVDRRQGERRSR